MNRIVAGILVLLGSLIAPAAQADDIRMQDVPQPVRASIERESKGQKLIELERESENGRTVYEAEWRKGDRKVEIKLDDSGTVLERSEKLI